MKLSNTFQNHFFLDIKQAQRKAAVYVDLLYYKRHKINQNCGGSYIDSLDVAERLIRTLKKKCTNI